jgi:proteasome lid subunit RPN8/RPN11
MPGVSDDVLMSESVLDELTKWSAAAAPNETGGILLGMLSDGRRWITTAREITSTRPRSNRYEIPARVTKRLVLEAREADSRLGYLGDWHSHPADSGPSGIDLGTYLRLLGHAIRRNETTPLLVVVRHEPEGWTLDLTTSVAWPFRPRPLDLTMTGQPSPPVALQVPPSS